MAGVIGFEPMHDGFRVHCLTAWLHPKITVLNYYNTRLRKNQRKNVLMDKKTAVQQFLQLAFDRRAIFHRGNVINFVFNRFKIDI